MDYKKNIEKNTAIIEITLPRNEYDDFEEKAYEKDKNQYKLEGFRAGKIPKKVLEKTYGSNIFFETAVNLILDKYYEEILAKEKDLDIIDRPDINVKSFDEKGITLVLTFPLFPEIKLGAYEGLEIEKEKVEVTDEEVDAELKKYQEQGARVIDVIDRPVANGDITTIDFEGKIDGVPFEGGTAKMHELEIGSHSFIDNFEDQIIGMNIGETKDVKVTFPENYHVAELKGKPAVFTVVLHGVKSKELPEINDEFASNCSTFETLEDFKKDIRRELLEKKEKDAEYNLEDKLISMISEKTEVEIPEVFVRDQLEEDIKRIDMSLQYQGINLDTYCKITGTTVEDFKKSRRGAAEENVKAQLVIQEIVKKENIKAEPEEVEAKIAEYAKSMNMTAEDYKAKAPANIVNSVTNAVIIEKLFKMLKEKNNIK